jgi:integration host factor subunit beta
MTKSELIEALARRQTHLAFADVEMAVKSVIEQMSHALAHGERIEVRGFGSFALHYRPPRMGRNPEDGRCGGACQASMCRISSQARNCANASI